MAKRADNDPIDEWLVQLDQQEDDEEKLDEGLLRQWAESLELLRSAKIVADEPSKAMSVAIHWLTGGSFNHGRVIVNGQEDVRIERYNVGDKQNPKWRFLLADEQMTYMHVDEREFATREELEVAAVEWLVDAGRISWLN